jgi:uncharacterized membrane protein YfcA
MKSLLSILFLQFVFINAQNNTIINQRVLFESDITLDIILIFIIFFISIITTIGGVGGGGLFIPAFMLLGKFKLEEAIPLSVITILGNTIVRMINLYNKRHPLNEKRYLIDMIPLLLIIPFDGNASFIGIMLSDFTPKILTIILIILTLGFTFYKSIKKAISSFLKENIFLNNKDNNIEMVVIDGIAEYFPKEDIEEAIPTDGEGDKLSDKIKKSILQLGVIFLISIFTITRTYINKCTLWYWLQILLQFVVINIIGYLIVKYISRAYEEKRKNNYIFLKGDIVWNIKNIIKFIIIGSVTGILSTYMGIGGGMLTTPVMINVGMIPEVVVATSSVSTFFSSMISVLNYIVNGKLLWDYGIIFSISSAFGSIIGLCLSNYILKKYKRQSIIIFIVSLILFTSTILLIINAVTKSDISNFEFKNICLI